MADETRLSDSISSLNEEEGEAPSPPEMDLIVEQDSSTSTSTSITKSSPNDVIFQEDQHPDSDSSSAAIPRSPTATATSNGDGHWISKGKETPFSAEEEVKEEDQESAKLNGGSVGRLPIGGILGFSEEAEYEKGEFGNGRKRSLQLGSTASSLELQLIDETALIGLISIPKPKLKPKPKPELAFKKKEDMAKAKKTKTNKSNTRRRENEGVKTKKKKEEEKGKMMRYSRERMEALRFVNVVEQRRMWKGVYLGLGPLVRKEYDFLLSSKQHCNNYIHFIFPHDQTHLHHQGNKIHSSSDFGIIAARGRWNHVNVYVH